MTEPRVAMIERWKEDDTDSILWFDIGGNVPKELGGQGSGFFTPEHHGRPGEVGGSATDVAPTPELLDDYNKYKEQGLDFIDKLTGPQLDAIREYRDGWFQQLNDWLKGREVKFGKPWGIIEAENAGQLQEVSNQLDSVLAMPEAKAKQDMLLTRGTKLLPRVMAADDYTRVIGLLENKIKHPDAELHYSPKGFLSMTSSRNIASEFSGVGLDEFEVGGRGVRFYVRVPSGFPAAPITAGGGEQEWLLPRNTDVVVTRVEKHRYPSKTVTGHRTWDYVVNGYVQP